MIGDEFFRQVANRRPFSRLHPRVAVFFKEYLANEKIVKFDDKYILNTHFPPYPSAAFDNFVEGFNKVGDASERRLYSVTFAVTNSCNYHCWHCYNAGRREEDIPLETVQDIAGQLQNLGAVMVVLSGGEPLLRGDLGEIARAFDDRTCITMNTTGDGLTLERAKSLKESGIFAMGISLDSMIEEKHDRLRGVKGAFHTALDALAFAGRSGIYPYIVTVGTHDFLEPERFLKFMEFAGKAGAKEVHLLEPSATGRLAGRTDVLLKEEDRKRILDYQQEVSKRADLPILSGFTYLESHDAFGCGAGLTHLYIDGSGEVNPCNLVPLSFGNLTKEPLEQILDRMGKHFCKPRSSCVGHLLSRYISEGQLPTPPEVSMEICEKYLPKTHSVPRFFQIREETREEVGQAELRSAYNSIGEFYDEFWLKEADKPVNDLVAKLSDDDKKRVLEAGCGTGFATVLLANKYKRGEIIAVDLSEGMLAQARKRAQDNDNIRFVAGDALEILKSEGPFDLVFSSWVLGYIPLKPFFAASCNALADRGQLAFVVHKENSPYEPLQIFAELIAENPSVLLKRVSFDFPPDMNYLQNDIKTSGLTVEHIWDGKVVFRYNSAREVLDHLLKSGAGTAFYDAIDPSRRSEIEERFLKILSDRHRSGKYEVIHDYISCIAGKQ